MSRYTIKATVSVEVEMSIEADSADAARKAFDDGICMTAELIDTPREKYDVSEDSIAGIEDVRIERERS